MKSRRKESTSRSSKSADASFAKVVAALTADGRVQEARMFGASGLRVKGKFFAMIYGGELVVKLPRARAETLVKSGRYAFFDPGHGRLMKEWIVVPVSNTSWVTLSRDACEYVSGDAGNRTRSRMPRRQ